jgi:hypothetical protein
MEAKVRLAELLQSEQEGLYEAEASKLGTEQKVHFCAIETN